MSPGSRPASTTSCILIHSAVWPKQTWAENWGLCAFGGAGSPSNTLWPGPKLTCMPSGILIHRTFLAAIHRRHKQDRQDKTDRQRFDRMGRTIFTNGLPIMLDETRHGDMPRPLDGDPASLSKGAQPPIFGPCLLQPNGWIDQDSPWYGGRPRPRRHCVRWGDPLPKKGDTSAPDGHNPNFRILWPYGWMDQGAT